MSTTHHGELSTDQIHPTAIIGGEPEQRGFDGAIQAAVIDDTAKIGAYVTVDGGINRPTEVGARSWLMKHVHLGHDVIVGADVEIAPGTVVGGGAYIGDEVKIGINATILPRQVIGKGAVIGAGAVVTKDVRPGAVMVGNPARPVDEPSSVLVHLVWADKPPAPATSTQ